MQTIWPALLGRYFLRDCVEYRRERWEAPDGDFVDVDWLNPQSEHMHGDKGERPLLVLFHGLEGSSQSHYAKAFARYSKQQGWRFAVPHFRGCSGEINRAPRAYHSGDFTEIDWILRRMRSMHEGPIIATGVSLGGNALLRWAQELGASANAIVKAVSAVCAPLDLNVCGHALGKGFNSFVYTPMFLRTMKAKASLKWNQYPRLFDRDAMLAARNLYEFDAAFTAPLHGFKGTDDYWERASAKPQLKSLQVPTLIVNAQNDPFVPEACLPALPDISASVTLWQPRYGGHVGFPAGWPPGHLQSLPNMLEQWIRPLVA